MNRTLFVLSLFGFALLAGCHAPQPFKESPEPWRTNFQTSLRDTPNSQFALACHGDPAALHSYFALSVVPLDGPRAEAFGVTIPAIYSYLGRRRFLEALSHEAPDIQQAMGARVPYYR